MAATSCFRKIFYPVLLFLMLYIVSGSDAKPNDGANGTPAPDTEKRSEYESIAYLHQLLDEDLSGYIDVKESDEFLNDELNIKGKTSDRVSALHKDDPQITVDELWKSWSMSEVHNWTVDEVVLWLVNHVELPQYSDHFRRQNVNGTLLPRLASNQPEYLTSTLGVRDPIHKRKVSLKATDAVLFGSPRARDPLSAYKEWIFFSSLIIASCGIWVAYSQRKKYEAQMRHMAADLERIKALEKDLAEMQSTEGSALGSNEDDALSLAPAERERLHELEQENTLLREALERAEHRVQATQWYAPVDLELVLQKTYSVELQYFKGKRAAAERQLLAAKEECEKLHKKQQSVLGAFRVTHGSQLNNVDDQLVAAKTALGDLASDIQDRQSRWGRIEALTGFHIVSTGADAHKREREKSFARRDSFDAEDRNTFARGSVRSERSGSPVMSRAFQRHPVAHNSRQLSDEHNSDDASVYSQDVGSVYAESVRKTHIGPVAPVYGIKEFSRGNDVGADTYSEASVASKARVPRLNEEMRQGSLRKLPDVSSDVLFSASWENDNGRATESDQETRAPKRSTAIKKVFSNLSLSVHHKKIDH
ncbi:stromal interaction molecule homolog [Paramacrobiotus metropolitanus]|uniref:stromal interaction molecule homolog n=1 Tax=Paramacrobiotus metropolitanus TaxID=2943436 RepID=UPI002445CA18|nr:stromal interaction molecule homolog [Paramacrobiotus metropolitanus]